MLMIGYLVLLQLFTKMGILKNFSALKMESEKGLQPITIQQEV